MENNFYSDKEQEGEFPMAFDDYLQARAEGKLHTLNFSEEEFEYVIDRLMDEGDGEAVMELSGVAFEKLPYSVGLLSRYCDTLILYGNPQKALEILSQYEDSYRGSAVVQFLFARANVSLKKFRHARDYFYNAL